MGLLPNALLRRNSEIAVKMAFGNRPIISKREKAFLPPVAIGLAGREDWLLLLAPDEGARFEKMCFSGRFEAGKVKKSRYPLH